jgi:hypothetical protein
MPEKEPTEQFLIHLAHALGEAEHKNVAEHIAAGLLWAIYPQWWERVKHNFNSDKHLLLRRQR